MLAIVLPPSRWFSPIITEFAHKAKRCAPSHWLICSGSSEGTTADASPVLADGTQSPDLFLKPGDRVEVKSPAIGTLSARIVAKAAHESARFELVTPT